MVFLSESDFEKMNKILSIKDNKPKKKKQSEIFVVNEKKGRTVARKRKIKEVRKKGKKNKNSLYY